MENDNFNKNENQSQTDFNINENIEIVETAPENKNNKVIIILIICVLAIALISGILLIIFKNNEPSKEPETTSKNDIVYEENPFMEEFYSNLLEETITDTNGNEISREEYVTQLQQQIQEATTVLSQNVGNQSPNQIIENTTTENTTSAAPVTNSKIDEQIEAFFNRTFFLKGALYTNGVGDPIYISMDGSNFEILTNIDGTELSLLRIDGTMYIKRSATKQYVELTESFFEMMELNPEAMTFNFGDVNYNDIKEKATITDITINGNPGKCYIFKNQEKSFKFYYENDSLKQIEIYELDGTLASEFSIDLFTTSIPGDQLSLKGYTKTGLGTIFADLM